MLLYSRLRAFKVGQLPLESKGTVKSKREQTLLQTINNSCTFDANAFSLVTAESDLTHATLHSSYHSPNPLPNDVLLARLLNSFL